MKNISVIVVTLIVLVAVSVGIYLSFFSITDDDEGNIIDQTGETITVTGVVVDNVQEVPADGDNYLLLDTDEGRRIVLYEQGGLFPDDQADQQCNQNTLMALEAQTLEAGDTVEVSGALNAEGNVEICSDTAYTITILDRANSQENAVAETREVSGEVVEFISDCAFDGNCAYVVETDDGERVTVIWAEGSSPICQNDPFNGGDTDIDVGNTIDAFGRVINDNTMSGCGDPSYYITKTS